MFESHHIKDGIVVHWDSSEPNEFTVVDPIRWPQGVKVWFLY